MENKQTFTRDEIIERMNKAFEELSGKELADICNREFGMSIAYNGDDLFEETD